MRTIRYQEIAQSLRDRLRNVGPGHVLPSESELSAEFNVSRVTIRRFRPLIVIAFDAGAPQAVMR